MELVTVLIGVAVFILSASFIYCISFFSMREKTFEEVIEEQKRRQEEEEKKLKSEKKAEKEQQKKKYKKGKQEKVKEKSLQVTEPDLKGEHKMVNLEIEPEIIEPTETMALSSSVRQRGKKEKVKSILQNKGEPTLVAEKTVELHHKPVVPKDELELKKIHQTKEERIEAVIVKTVQKEVAKESTRVKKTSESKEKENLPPKEKKHREEEKQVKPKEVQEAAPLSGSKLISTVKHAKLSDQEVQTLIDILLNKQGIASTGAGVSESWNKKSQKGDPVSMLKKQLEEKERALQEEQNIAMSANARLKEMKNELSTEKTKLYAMEKRYQEQVAHQKADMDALHKRIEHTHAQHLIETNNLQSRLRTADQGAERATSQKLSEENKILQETLSLKAKENVSLTEKLKSLEKEVNSGQSKVQAGENVKKNLETKVKTYEDKIRQLEAAQRDVDAMINKRIEEVTHELRKAEGKNSSLTAELQSATGALGAARGEVSTLKAKLQELETHLTKVDQSKEAEARLQEEQRKRSDLEGNVKNLEKQLSDLSQRLTSSETDVKRLRQENHTLTDENKKLNERVQMAEAPSNGDVHENGPSVSLVEHERLLSEKNAEVKDLTSGLESQKKTVSNLQAQLDNKIAEVADLTEQMSQQKAKNNELREKNWKVMEAFQLAEKTSAEKVDKAMKSAREKTDASVSELESYDKSVFQRLFPSVQVSDKLSHKEWIVAFEKQAVKKISNVSETEFSKVKDENERLKGDLEAFKNTDDAMRASEDKVKHLDEENSRILKQVREYETKFVEVNSRLDKLKELEAENSQLKSSLSSQSSADTEKCSRLEAENSRLSSEVEHFRCIVLETENKLRQLEKTIDDEEKKWQEKLKKAQSETQGKDSASLKRLQELETLVAQQEKQMQEYRKVLSATEARLVEFENKVVAQEKAWEEKLKNAQSELSQTKGDLYSMKHQVQQTQGSQEMQTKVESLEEELREARDRIIVITKEKESVVTQMTETHTVSSSSDSDSLNQQITELRTLLDSEKKKNKDLSLNVVKLNGIIKTGQDALTQEQGLVKKLQESLDSKSMSSGLSEMEEVDQASSSNAENGTSV